ncbi:hypothetical protein BJF82_07675 [Kytococcus sp. CUA-901]|nr:hypothetical protein BJF82_07675 [Kytococcus sp. CUA-901]
MTVTGAPAYLSDAQKAAALLHSVATHHPLVDDNKRLAPLAVVVLLDLQGLRLDLAPDDAVDLVMAVAFSELCEVDAIARRLRTAPAQVSP